MKTDNSTNETKVIPMYPHMDTKYVSKVDELLEKILIKMDQLVAQRYQMGLSTVVFVRDLNGGVLVDHSELMYLEANGAYTLLHLSDDTVLTASYHLGTFLNELQNSSFIKTSRSYLVNTKFIRKLWSKQLEIELTNNQIIPITRHALGSLKKMLTS